jgi:uroporphyrin-III C-methyltransferase
VIVLYMALKHLPNIVARLIAGGRRRDEPAAVIGRATTEAQRVLVSSLGELAAAAGAIEAPAIVVVGEVVRLRARLDWHGSLSGPRLDPDPPGRGECGASG